MKLDYRTFWPEEEPPTTKGEGQRPPLVPRRSLTVGVLPLGPRRRRQQRGTAVMRGIGPHVALYFLLGAMLPCASLGLLWLFTVLFNVLFTLLAEMFF